MFLNTIVRNTVVHGKSELSRIDYLDGWRGIAILLVLMEHFFHVREVDVGRLGVDIFFVLSGMLMANILFVKKVPLVTFYKRRISRIFPVFFIFITTVSICSLIFNLSSEHNNYLYNLFFLRAYYPTTPDLWSTGLPIGHLWSLNVEEHCYIILSIITLVSILYKKAYLTVLFLGISSILIQYLYVRVPDIAPSSYHLRTEVVSSFLLISAGYFLIKQNFEKFIPTWAPIVTFILSVICYSSYSPHWTAKWSLAPFLLAFTVNHLNLVPNYLKNFLSTSILRLVGLWSFSIYLWQQPFYYYGTKFSNAFPFAGIILFVVTIFVGALSFYLIENPIRKYVNSKW